jgi:four helix bundle protein
MLNLSHKKLDVYQYSLNLVKLVYSITNSFPKEEQYLLTVQLRRAVISVCSNIAEGAARASKIEKKRFYEVARSSIVEIDTQMGIAILLNYTNKEKITELESQVQSIFRMLSKMIDNLNLPTGH